MELSKQGRTLETFFLGTGATASSSTGKDGKLVNFEDTLTQDGLHCVHCMIWANMEGLILERYTAKAAVLMQMRFDGALGFPGGMVDDCIYGLEVSIARKKILDALNRELQEEVNLDTAVIFATDEDYRYTQRHDKDDKLYCHFFTLKVTIKQFVELERRALYASDYGDEVMGHLRVPLYTMEDGDRGFLAFIRNNFVGPALTQLFLGLYMTEIFDIDELYEADAINSRRVVDLVKRKINVFGGHSSN